MLQQSPTFAARSLGLRPAIAGLPSSKIREIAHAGMGRADHIPLWFGEPDTPTPQFICDAAAQALAAGDTFYQPNAAIQELRLTLAEYMNRGHARGLRRRRRYRRVRGGLRLDRECAGLPGCRPRRL